MPLLEGLSRRSHTLKQAQKWNFELPRVKSINTSGHKFGLVYAGVGWIIWRDESYLPKCLVFELHYLGGTEESYTLNLTISHGQVRESSRSTTISSTSAFQGTARS